MRVVFADTFYFLSLASDKDGAHTRAVLFSESYRGQVLTTEWVLTEFGDAFSKSPWRNIFLTTLERLRDNSQVTIVEATHDLFERAVRLFATRPDKSWSLTDCTSFLVMEDHGVVEALTADQHFTQAGFVALLE
jgi:predicted nucleic acid-binding protein